MKWPEVITAILHYDQIVDKIVYEKGWELDFKKIKILCKVDHKWKEFEEKTSSKVFEQFLTRSKTGHLSLISSY